MQHPLKGLVLILMVSSAINASGIPDVEAISNSSEISDVEVIFSSSRINRKVISGNSAHTEDSKSNYCRYNSSSSIEPPLRSHRPEVQTAASPIAMVIVNNIIPPERTTSKRVSTPHQHRRTAYRLPDDIQGLYKASQGSDKGRSTAAFEELKKKAQGGSLTAIDYISKCYINGYGCSMSEHWSNFWQDKYDRARKRR